MNTEFNVGDGYWDETDGYNHIQIVDTSGTLNGLTNTNDKSVPGSLYYDITIRGPGCHSIDPENLVSLKSDYGVGGSLVGATTLDFELVVLPWEDSVYDTKMDQSEFGICIQVDIVTTDNSRAPVVLVQKRFEVSVSILSSRFVVSNQMEGATSWISVLPCSTSRKRVKRSLK